MERKISTAKHQFLREESSRWVEEGIISPEIRDGIMSGYASAKQLPAVIWALGVTMIGLGVLSFIAANWDALGRFVKITLIVGLYAASVAAAYFCEIKGRKTAAETLILLSGFLLMGGIALMSQVFHISGSVESLLLTWLIVYMPAFLIVRKLPIFLLYEVVTLFYLNTAFIYYMKDNGSFYGMASSSYALREGPAGPFLIGALLLGMAWRMWAERKKLPDDSAGSPVKYVFIGGSTRRIFFGNFLILNWFTWMCVINSRHETVLPYIFGVLAIGALITFIAGKLDAADLEWQGLLIVGAAGLSLTARFVWDLDFSFKYAGSGYYTEGTLSAPVLSSVLLGAYLVSRILLRYRGGGFSAFLFCALLARWYFDLFYTFMDTAIFFISGGIFLILVAYAYKKWHKLGGQSPDAGNGGGGDENIR
ncbi:MAG: DUF2157 domain-containing protein [Synergistaceae bacterium]|nr:DUF2157 domain-containing protein [Synergistaceae bacterium]